MEFIKKNYIALAWLLSLLVMVVGAAAWLQELDWRLNGLTAYKLFPVFGLAAFSLMWSMYMVGFGSRKLKIKSSQLHSYYEVTGWLVLVLIVLHPSLLIWQLWRDGLGLPPGSYLSYVAANLKWIALLGTASLLVFLAYELRRFYRSRKWWKYLDYAVDGAMIAILYHGLRLGGQLGEGWFRYVWFFYGITLAIVFYDKYNRILQTNKTPGVRKLVSWVDKNPMLALLVVIAAVGTVWLGQYAGNKYLNNSQNNSVASGPIVECKDSLAQDFKCWRTHYQQLVEQKSTQEALADVKAQYESNSYIYTNCHQIIHVIGRAAGKKYGDLAEAYRNGNDFCWSGYYHGVVEAIAYDIGPDEFVAKINDICASLRESERYKFSHYNCAHGLGHGLMAIQGNELFVSLSSCDQLKDGWERGSCYGGVFMENIMSEVNPDHHTDYLKDDDLLYPCNAVDVKYAYQCYQMQTSHALKVVGYDFARIFQLCTTVPAPNDATCFKSLGRDASGSTISDPQRTKDICMMGPSDEAKRHCVIGAALDFVSYHHSDRPALAFCDILVDAFKVECINTVKSYYTTF
ncbi:hypothetical protein A3E49_03335 [Candidatus Saccharibacteria bacterium RIFCSPHIGHO2_12_FULL_49_19]|nr:MAG: hypothetical protein A2708_01635 [Candidatus Saccharibacteria bacterium RIFCSPHIGHO2_01_FULL_49_21]OGL36948.1 MAG: hypothetical protein A3E49_03335 [Candidatus Saccharibacteria bacterium RIFCSPHIGHO2_12_FULL_49_19]OGL37761.1 MAG: hypothetical protein A3B63_00210 [Candidatus Saccharibacteria bacterium RIFCSPLOWO2_01_FULL_49_22]